MYKMMIKSNMQPSVAKIQQDVVDLFYTNNFFFMKINY